MAKSKRRPSARPRATRDDARVEARRTERARLRAHRVKVWFIVTAATAFLGAMLFARMSYAGHSKHGTTLLNAPRRFLGIVRANRLQAGVVAPPTAPPSVVSAPS